MTMLAWHRSKLILGLIAACSAAAIIACDGDDAANKLGGRNTGGGGNGGTGGDGSTGGTGGSSGSSDPNAVGGPPQEQVLFSALLPDFQKNCGGTCHEAGTYKPTPPTFLAPPDAYKSVKSHPGLITADVYQSALVTKGAHAGPALSSLPDFEKKIIEWLQAEALAIQAVKLPSTDPIAVVAGPNDIDLTKACTGGLVNIHLKFTGSMVGTILKLTDMKIVAPAGTDVHILKPKFYKVLDAAQPDGTKEIVDGADSFSNIDQTVPNGAETQLGTGEVLFTSDGWIPFDLTKDKIRIEAEKIEPGKVTVTSAPATCKDPAGFAANVLPNMKGGGGFNLNCSSCHGGGLAGLSLNSTDNKLVCNQVLGKLNQGDITKSLIITKVTTGPHNGGTINNAANWTAVFQNNKAVFF